VPSHGRPTRVSLIPFIQALSLVLVFALPVVWASQVYTSSPVRYDRVIVHQGDTVWGLVAARAAAGSDINELTYDVMSLNRLVPQQRLHAGQVLLLPRN